MSKNDRLNLQEWVRDGYFSSLGYRPDRLSVEAVLGEPDDFGAGENELILWRFGAVEFHFSPDGELLAVHIDNFGVVSDRDDMWGLDACPDMETVKVKLNDLDVRFDLIFSVDTHILNTETDIVFAFDSETKLTSVSQEFMTSQRSRQITVTLDQIRYAKLQEMAVLADKSMSDYLSELASGLLDESDEEAVEDEQAENRLF